MNTETAATNGNIRENKQQSNIFAPNTAVYEMQSKLIVDNFGPIVHAELDLRNISVFIGLQACGKSALAKIYTIFKAPRKFFYKVDADKNGGDKV